MGLYINPTDGSTKEEFLAKYGRQVAETTASVYLKLNTTSSEMLPVVLVDNVLFTAAGVCDTLEEFNAFTRPSDIRPKKFYLVPRSALREFGGIIPKGAV